MSAKKKHILFLASWYPNRYAPDLGIFIRRHAQSIAHDYHVSVVYARSSASVKKTTVELNTVEGVTEAVVYFPKVSHSLPGISQMQKFSRYRAAMRQGIDAVIERNGSPALVHLHVIFPAALAALPLVKRLGVPLLITEHWSGYLPEDGHYRGALMKRVTQSAVRNAAMVTAVSDKMIAAMRNHGLEARYVRLNNVVDTNLFVPVTPKKKHSAPLRLVHVSSLVEREKNIRGLLHVVKELEREEIDFTLDIVGGSAHDVHRYEAQVNADDASGCVFFHGRQSPEKLAVTLRNSDALILFSHFEGMPVVIAEAQACGLPVIATNTGAIPEMIDHDDGYLLPPGDEAALAAAVRELNKNIDTFDATAIRAKAVARYSVNAVSIQLKSIYDSIPGL